MRDHSSFNWRIIQVLPFPGQCQKHKGRLFIFSLLQQSTVSSIVKNTWNLHSPSRTFTPYNLKIKLLTNSPSFTSTQTSATTHKCKFKTSGFLLWKNSQLSGQVLWWFPSPPTHTQPMKLFSKQHLTFRSSQIRNK